MKENRRHWLAAAVLLAAGALAGAVGRPLTSSAATAEESLDTRYAQAQLKLAETNLKRVQRINELVTKAVSANMVADYQQDVEVARLRLQVATKGTKTDEFQVWLRRAQASFNGAQIQLSSAVAAVKQKPSAYSPLDVERLRLRADVARLLLERGHVVAAASPEAQVQWQMNLLSDEVQRLNDEVRRGVYNSPIYLRWQ